MNLLLRLPDPAERPRERCLRHGPTCLSLRECIALLLGSGSGASGSSMEIAERLLNRIGRDLPEAETERAFFTAFEGRPDAWLSQLLGLGAASQARLLATFEIARRYAVFRCDRLDPRPVSQGRGQEALQSITPSYRSEPAEWLGFIPIYGHGPGRLCIVEKGVRTHVNTEPAELFARVLALRPQAFVLAHNHPSGQLLPSSADYRLTRAVSLLASQLGIPLLGHWIVSTQGEHWIDPASN